MRNVTLDVVGSTSFDRYRKQSLESTYNMIISDNALVPFSGYQKVADILPEGVSRELFRSTVFDHLVAIVDDGFYIISTALGVTRVGNLDTLSGPVFVAENTAGQIAAVDGVNVYVFNHEANTFQTINVDFEPVYIDFQDTYFIAADGRSRQWRLSEQDDGTIWPSRSDPGGNEAYVGQISTKADIMVAAVAFNRQLFAIGKDSTEIWHDVGNTLFPYQRDNSISIDYGCLSSSTIASGFGLLVWLASNEKAGPTIVFSAGGAPRTLSTDGINFIIDKLKNPQDSTGFLFEEDGHIFYQITFISDDVSYVYDFTTNKFFNVTDHCLKAHIARRVAFFNNTYYFISKLGGSLYEMGTQFTTYNDNLDPDEAGFIIPRLRITKNYRLPNAARYLINNVNVTLEQGASSTEQKVELSLSKNGNASFGSGVSKILNPLGVHPNKLQWWQLGASNDTTFQFRFIGRSRFVIINGEVIITT